MQGHFAKKKIATQPGPGIAESTAGSDCCAESAAVTVSPA
jgi:hypothetical protein